MAVWIFLTAVENTPTDRAIAQQQLDQMHLRPLAPGLSGSSIRKGSGSGASPAEQFHGLVEWNPVLPRRANRGAARWSPPPTPSPTGPVVGHPIRPRRLHAPFHQERSSGGEILLRADGRPASATRWPIRGTPAANQVPPGPGPAPLALPQRPVLLAWAAPAGPERHCRERRGPSAGDGLGNRGAIRAGLLCRDREHGGTQTVSRRPGSPREARREGPTRAAHLISRQLSLEACRCCFLLSIDPHVVDPGWRDDLPHLADDGSVGGQSAGVPGLVTSAESGFRAGKCSMRLFGMRPTGRPRLDFIMKALAGALPRGWLLKKT